MFYYGCGSSVLKPLINLEVLLYAKTSSYYRSYKEL